MATVQGVVVHEPPARRRHDRGPPYGGGDAAAHRGGPVVERSRAIRPAPRRAAARGTRPTGEESGTERRIDVRGRRRAPQTHFHADGTCLEK